MICRLISVFLLVVLALAVPRNGLTNNGIVELEIPFGHTEDYIECLGEGIQTDLTVTVRTHVVELRGGGVHYVENWFIEGTAVGQSTGMTWAGHGTSPYQANGGGANWTEGFNVAVDWKPLDGGRRIKESQRIRLVVDANGVTRLEQLEPLHYRCIGR